MSRFLNVALFGAALIIPVAMSPTTLRADDRVYHDREHNDDHRWDNREDRAYRSWAKENHRKYQDFSRLREDDQQAYWTWRHQHPEGNRDRHESGRR
jgi:hypothetical protein